ncbi:MAG: hypothetical protein ABI613_02325 [Gemmatimonadota bacterium]
MHSVMAGPRFSLLAALFLCGCTGWNQVDVAALPPMPEYQQLQVWSHDMPYLLHSVHVYEDSITGVSVSRTSDACDSCRVVFRRSEVDSIRRGGTTNASHFAAGLGVGLTAAYATLLMLASAGN